MKKAEQIDKSWFNRGNRENKQIKKATNRKERREAKRDPEGAPKRHAFRGYTV